MADEEKQKSSNSNEQGGSLNENRGQGTIIKSQIPDFKYSSPVPEKPSTTTTDKTDE